MNWPYILNVFLLVFGFGFVIFWHELGHFLAAKWVGIRVEQFAVGFGHALLSWRKGMGVQVGTSGRKYEELHKRAAEGDPSVNLSKYGETEYRLNWIPLGGYVKMLGQDDLNPTAQSGDPHSYNRKSVAARMLVVSAGVIMNVILAGILFMILFRTGFTAPANVVGNVLPNSPAQVAGVQVGDRLVTYEGKVIHDFTKLMLNVALSDAGATVPLVVRRNVDGQEQTLKLQITPQREQPGSKQFVALGIQPPRKLQAFDAVELPGGAPEAAADPIALPDLLAMKPGDQIVKINDVPLQSPRDIITFHRVLQQSKGQPVTLTLDGNDGQVRVVEIQPRFAEPFGTVGFNLAGLTPRSLVASVMEESPAKGKLLPGDVVLSVSLGSSDTAPRPPTRAELVKLLGEAGNKDQAVDLTVRRGEATVVVKGVVPSIKLEQAEKRRGLGIGLEHDLEHAVVAQPLPGSPADRAGIGRGGTITAINDQPVKDWHDIYRLLRSIDAPGAVEVSYLTEAGEARSTKLPLTKQDLTAVASNFYTLSSVLPLAEWKEERKTDSVLTAAMWGTTETRDFILQFYLTLRRMVDGNVDPSNLMGPIGIFHAGTHFAYRGHDWLIWFLAMISANLAVVNFLPIPIVDGGLFTFLILEKIKGKPVSARTQSIAQVVGLVLLLGVFLFVTYNDITRLF